MRAGAAGGGRGPARLRRRRLPRPHRGVVRGAGGRPGRPRLGRPARAQPRGDDRRSRERRAARAGRARRAVDARAAGDGAATSASTSNAGRLVRHRRPVPLRRRRQPVHARPAQGADQGRRLQRRAGRGRARARRASGGRRRRGRRPPRRRARPGAGRVRRAARALPSRPSCRPGWRTGSRRGSARARSSSSNACRARRPASCCAAPFSPATSRPSSDRRDTPSLANAVDR